jgi:hypothetical protein
MRPLMKYVNQEMDNLLLELEAFLKLRFQWGKGVRLRPTKQMDFVLAVDIIQKNNAQQFFFPNFIKLDEQGHIHEVESER